MRASTPSSDWQALAPPGTAGPLLAATALTGIALVSLVGLFLGGATPIPPLIVPPDVVGAVVLVAPGSEAVLMSFPDPERVRLHPSWKRLPAIDSGYTVVLPEDAALPRLPLGWATTAETVVGEWRWVGLATEAAGGEADRYDFLEHISEADVFFRDPNGPSLPCDRWRFGRWSCGLQEWLWVGPTEQVFRGRSEACLWAHPWTGHDLVVRFPAVPRGTRLMGRYGLTDSAVTVADGAPVSLLVRADGAERTFVAENREGFQTWQLRLEPTDAESVAVELVVRADGDGRRHFCFSGGMQGIGAPPRDGERLDTPEPGSELGGGLPAAVPEQSGGGDGLGTGVDPGSAQGSGTALGTDLGPGTGLGTGSGARPLGRRRLESLPPTRIERAPLAPAAP